MGKDLKGKELGTGITQRKDKKYVGRYTSVDGRRVQKIFPKLQECRKWLNEEQYNDQHRVGYARDVTLDTWFDYWIGIKTRIVRTVTVYNNTVVYKQYIQPVLGNRFISEITTAQCQMVLNIAADKGLKTSSIRPIKQMLKALLEYAVQYGVIPKNPCNNAVKTDIGAKSMPRQALTTDEQIKLCNVIKGTEYENQYRFLLQTGLRISELSGLKWSDIDLKKRTLTISRSIKLIKGAWITSEPKTNAGKRVVPLTNEAISILQAQLLKNKSRKVINAEWTDNVFVSRNGKPITTPSYDTNLKKMCIIANIPNASVHTLRHTFATRCIEAGMQPKVLQSILGHSDISMTLNRYVHATEDYKTEEMNKIEEALKVV